MRLIGAAYRHFHELAQDLIAFDARVNPTSSRIGILPAVYRTIIGRNGAVEFELKSGPLKLQVGMFDRKVGSEKPTTEMVSKVFELAKIDPQVLAPGISAITHLPSQTMLYGREVFGFDSKLLRRVADTNPDAIILAPWFNRHGGGEKYTRDLALALRECGLSVLVITTEHGLGEKTNLHQSIPGSPSQAMISTLIWSDLCFGDVGGTQTLIDLVDCLSPRIFTVINSTLGLEAMRSDIPGFRNNLDEYAVFFSMDTSRVASQFGVIYPKHLRHGVKILSDNQKSLIALEKHNPSRKASEFHVLPAKITEAPAKVFERNLIRTISNQGRHGGSNWIWLSRLTSQKGTRVLGALSDLRPQDTFHVYGARGKESLKTLGLKKKNIIVHGEFTTMADVDPGKYDGFIFTSQFEGQPLAVLELATYGIPVIATNVGDLGSLFGQDSVLFVESSDDDLAVAEDFHQTISRLLKEDAATLQSRLTAMRTRVLEWHSPSAHKEIIREVFNCETK